jgi:hypothetical protein
LTKEAAAARELRRACSIALDASDTTLDQYTATLTPARLSRLHGATAIVVCALEYSVEQKKILAAAVEALDKYVAWLEEERKEHEEKEEEEGDEKKGASPPIPPPPPLPPPRRRRPRPPPTLARARIWSLEAAARAGAG